MPTSWSPDAQLTGLKFNGILALIISLHFLYIIIKNVLETFTPDAALLSNLVFQKAPLVAVFVSCILMLRYLFQLKRLSAGGWRSMFIILKDEYALSIYRNAGAKSFSLVIHLCMLFYFISVLQSNNAILMTLLNVQTVSATLIFSSGVVFSWVVLRHLQEEDN